MSNNIPGGMIEFKSDPELYSKLAKTISEVHYDVKLPKMTKFTVRNPNKEVENLLNQQNEKLNQQTKELQSIRYENMKLNAQIDTLNKTVDSQNDELARLRDTNSELKVANQTLKDNNRHYWRNTILIGIFTTVLGILLGKYI